MFPAAVYDESLEGWKQGGGERMRERGVVELNQKAQFGKVLKTLQDWAQKIKFTSPKPAQELHASISFYVDLSDLCGT